MCHHNTYSKGNFSQCQDFPKEYTTTDHFYSVYKHSKLWQEKNNSLVANAKHSSIQMTTVVALLGKQHLMSQNSLLLLKWNDCDDGYRNQSWCPFTAKHSPEQKHQLHSNVLTVMEEVLLGANGALRCRFKR